MVEAHGYSLSTPSPSLPPSSSLLSGSSTQLKSVRQGQTPRIHLWLALSFARTLYSATLPLSHSGPATHSVHQQLSKVRFVPGVTPLEPTPDLTPSETTRVQPAPADPLCATSPVSSSFRFDFQTSVIRLCLGLIISIYSILLLLYS